MYIWLVSCRWRLGWWGDWAVYGMTAGRQHCQQYGHHAQAPQLSSNPTSSLPV